MVPPIPSLESGNGVTSSSAESGAAKDWTPVALLVLQATSSALGLAWEAAPLALSLGKAWKTASGLDLAGKAIPLASG